MAILIAAAKAFQRDLDKIAPNRKKPDGWIGDPAHRNRTSSHNPDETGNVPIRDADSIDEVHALDIADELNTNITLEHVIQYILKRCRQGSEKRIRYIIYKERIWSATSGWIQNRYDGDNPHNTHGHFDISYTTSLESNTDPYLPDLTGDNMPTVSEIWNAEIGPETNRETAIEVLVESRNHAQKAETNSIKILDKFETLHDAIDVSTGQIISKIDSTSPVQTPITDEQLTRCIVKALAEMAAR